MISVLAIIPMRPNMNASLRSKALAGVYGMLGANPGLDLSILIDTRHEPHREGDDTPWCRVCRVRNRIINSLDLTKHDYLMWIDADVVDYPPDLPTRLIETGGIVAPMVIVEKSARFYDRAAFVMLGKSNIAPNDWHFRDERQLAHDAPYWPSAPTADLVEMDCVGTIYIVPASVYLRGVRHTDHPAFTDHFEICRRAREMGIPVQVDRRFTAYHANLPEYGERWH